MKVLMTPILTDNDVRFITDMVLALGIYTCFVALGLWAFNISTPYIHRTRLRLELARRKRFYSLASQPENGNATQLGGDTQ